MNYPEKQKSSTYVLQAPPPTDPSLIPSIYWIELRKGQGVEWRWTRFPDGNRVVTGYEIIERGRFDRQWGGGGSPET